MKRDIADTIADCLIEDHIELMKENESLKAELAEARSDVKLLDELSDDLQRELAALKGDADRYRWLVENDMTAEYSDYTTYRLNKMFSGYKYDFDAAIDAAMQGKDDV